MVFEARDLMVDVLPSRMELDDQGTCRQTSKCAGPSVCDAQSVCIAHSHCAPASGPQPPCPPPTCGGYSLPQAALEEDVLRLAPLAVLREQLQQALRS